MGSGKVFFGPPAGRAAATLWLVSIRTLPALLAAAAALPLAAPCRAQLLAAREHSFAAGRQQLNVSDLAAHRLFWSELLGGEMARFGGAEVVKLPDMLLLLRQRAPDGPSAGSTVNHLGFKVPDLDGLAERLRAAGFELVTRSVVAGASSDIHFNEGQGVRMAFVRGPDGVRVELIEDPGLERTTSHHIHIFTADDGATRDWYAERFGGEPGTRGRFKKADFPGIELTFAPSDGAAQPTQGRAVDRIGFEVDGLEALCRRLESQGLEFDVPYRRIDELDLGVALLTDPWGTYIELTEGLDGL